MANRSENRGSTHAGRTNPLMYSLKIGFFAGVIWGLVRWLAAAMNLTGVSAAFLADPWVPRKNLVYPAWQIAGLLLFILMSMAAALIYWALLRRYRGPAAGLIFGIAWWTALYLLVGPVMGAVPPLGKIGWNSLITDLCIFAAWGVFIGYSIAFEFHEEALREPKPSGA